MHMNIFSVLQTLQFKLKTPNFQGCSWEFSQLLILVLAVCMKRVCRRRSPTQPCRRLDRSGLKIFLNEGVRCQWSSRTIPLSASYNCPNRHNLPWIKLDSVMLFAAEKHWIVPSKALFMRLKHQHASASFRLTSWLLCDSQFHRHYHWQTPSC